MPCPLLWALKLVVSGVVMRSVVSCLVIFLSSICSVHADPISKIENANIVCSRRGGAVFINTQDKRLWQAEVPADKEGLELKIDFFNVFRCPNCYTIEGRFEGMEKNQTLRYQLTGVAGSFKKAKLQVTGIETTEEGGETTTTEEPTVSMKCKVN